MRTSSPSPSFPASKTEKEKFAGAEATYTVECHDERPQGAAGRAPATTSATSSARAYDVTFTGRDNKLQYPFQTSWGCTTRMIGAVIMTHGDNNGLVLPPKIAPIQVIVLPVAMHKAGVLEKAAGAARASEAAAGLRVQDGRFRQFDGLEVRRSTR